MKSAQTPSALRTKNTPEKIKRGRPRNPYSPEALIPFRTSKVTMRENLEQRMNPAGKSVKKKRNTNPATSYKDYTSEEIEFMNALNEFKRHSGHVFPTCSEILTVLRNLGYRKEEQTSS